MNHEEILQHLDTLLDTLSSIKLSPAWAEIINHPHAHPDLPTNFADCLTAAKDLSYHLDTTLSAMQPQQTLQEILDELLPFG